MKKPEAGSVFHDLGEPDADELVLKVNLTIEVAKRLKRRKLTQLQASAVLGVAQADVSRLLNVRPTRFSVERLMRLLTRLGCDVKVTVSTARRRAASGHVTIRAA